MPQRRRKTSSKSTSTKKRRSSRKKRSSKFALSGGAVLGLTLGALVLCATFLAYTFVAGSDTSVRGVEKAVAENAAEGKKASRGAENASEGKKTSSGAEKAAGTQKTSTRAESAAGTQKTISVAQSASDSKKTSSGAQNTTDSKKTSAPAASASEKIASVNSTKPEKPVEELPSSRYTIPPAVNGAKICFVIDDAGLNVANVKRYTSLPFPVTVAVLPRLSHSKDCAYVVRSSGQELILHQPMQGHAYKSGKVPDPGEGAILPGMTTYEIAETIKANLDEIGPNVKGMNNHEGSLVTENAIQMGAVYEVASERGIYFLDSRTTAHSAAPQMALELDAKYLARYAPFLDHESTEKDYMIRQLYKGLDEANKRGYAVMIGHVDKDVNVLPDLLNDIYPYLKKAGYVITTPSKL